MLQKKRYIRKVLTKRLDKINEIVNGNKYEKKKVFGCSLEELININLKFMELLNLKNFPFYFKK